MTGRTSSLPTAIGSSCKRPRHLSGGGLPLAFVSPWLGIACAGLVAFLWFLPKSPIDALFDG